MTLTKTWASLILLTLLMVALTYVDDQPRLVTGAVLLLAFLKARLILAGFLHLRPGTGWLGAFLVPIGLWMLAIFALYGIFG